MRDRTLIEIACEFRKGMLGGRPPTMMCFAISAPLQGYLSCLGLETELIKGELHNTEHYWLKLSDGRILDVTADQFVQNLPPIYLGKQPKHYKATP